MSFIPFDFPFPFHLNFLVSWIHVQVLIYTMDMHVFNMPKLLFSKYVPFIILKPGYF